MLYLPFIFAGMITVVLTILSTIDIKERRLPNKLVLIIAALGLGYVLIACTQLGTLIPLQSALFGMLYTAGPALAISLISKLISGQEGFGAGDIKLLAALGLYFGQAGIVLLPIACVLAAMVTFPQFMKKTRKHTIAFGPYLSIAAVITMAVLLLPLL